MASFTPRGYQQDESFWEVGLHLGLQLLLALPFAFLIDYLAELAHAKDKLPAMLGMLIGLSLGNWIVGWARARLHRSSHAQPETYARQSLNLVLPIAFPIAIGVDRLLTALDTGDLPIAFGGFIGFTVGDAIFHGLRSLRTVKENKP